MKTMKKARDGKNLHSYHPTCIVDHILFLSATVQYIFDGFHIFFSFLSLACFHNFYKCNS